MPDIHDDEKLKARREYYRKWRAKNPEKVRAAQIRYWQKRAMEPNTGLANKTESR